MEVFESLSQVKKDKKTVITLGTFDGVHLGHKKIIDKVKDRTSDIGGRNFLITFDPHPKTVVKENADIKLLTTLKEKKAIFEKLGVQNLLVINFTKEFSHLSYEEFFKKYIIDGIGVSEIVLGYDHHFGKDRGGNLNTLKEMQSQHDFGLDSVSEFKLDDITVSSTNIREFLVNGDLQSANAFLGRYYSFSGTVVEGDKRGRELGFPTVNISIEGEHKLLPALGIYAVEIFISGQKFLGVMSIGKRPTFYDAGKIVSEVYIFDFNKDVYGSYVTVNLVERIRGEEKFNSAEELIKQMQKDKESAISILKKLVN
jgi:riboflavin kinase / FMN adenylyltransferase